MAVGHAKGERRNASGDLTSTVLGSGQVQQVGSLSVRGAWPTAKNPRVFRPGSVKYTLNCEQKRVASRHGDG
ncbi:MAG: hypothetical protein F6K55_10030 [Moorea sp. SIO4A3]|nr:hypothetical protein [Moorena sp. SIO4A3]